VRPARLLLLLASIWIVLLLSAPVSGLGAAVSGLTYAFASLICHQRPDRSFHIGAAQLPVCARCIGLYGGAAIGAILTALAPGATLLPWSNRRVLRILLIAAALPTAITWGAEIVGLWSPVNATRFMAALPLGAAVALTVNYVECARPQRSESRLPPTPT
jgi:uncharacterized membrane protein